MKKTKTGLALLLLLALLLPLAACGSDPRAADSKRIVEGGVIITLTDSFRPVKEKEKGDFQMAQRAGDVRVCAQRSLRQAGSMLENASIADFASLLIASNPILRKQLPPPDTETADTAGTAGTSDETKGTEYVTAELQRENGVFFLEHTEHDSASGYDVRILTSLYKTPTAFWLIRFSAPVGAYEDYRAFFLRWAKSAAFYEVPETEAKTESAEE